MKFYGTKRLTIVFTNPNWHVLRGTSCRARPQLQRRFIMAHIYVNEDLNGDKEAYLILHGENPTARNVRLGITEYIENAWEYNPKLRGKVEKPTDNVTVKQLRDWV